MSGPCIGLWGGQRLHKMSERFTSEAMMMMMMMMMMMSVKPQEYLASCWSVSLDQMKMTTGQCARKIWEQILVLPSTYRFSWNRIPTHLLYASRTCYA